MRKQQMNEVDHWANAIEYFWVQAWRQQAIQQAAIVGSSYSSPLRMLYQEIVCFLPFPFPSLSLFLLPSLFSSQTNSSTSPYIWESSQGIKSPSTPLGWFTRKRMSCQQSRRYRQTGLVSSAFLLRQARRMHQISSEEQLILLRCSFQQRRTQWGELGCRRKLGLTAQKEGKLSWDIMAYAAAMRSYCWEGNSTQSMVWSLSCMNLRKMRKREKWYTMSLQDLFSFRCSPSIILFSGLPIEALMLSSAFRFKYFFLSFCSFSPFSFLSILFLLPFPFPTFPFPSLLSLSSLTSFSSLLSLGCG